MQNMSHVKAFSSVAAAGGHEPQLTGYPPPPAFVECGRRECGIKSANQKDPPQASSLVLLI